MHGYRDVARTFSHNPGLVEKGQLFETSRWLPDPHQGILLSSCIIPRFEFMTRYSSVAEDC
jgi:hypothetical protein